MKQTKLANEKPVQTFKQIILWLALTFGCWLPACALTLSEPENHVWELFSAGYDAAGTSAAICTTAPVKSTSTYDQAPIHSTDAETRSTQTERAILGQNAELKAAEGDAGLGPFAPGGVPNSYSVVRRYLFGITKLE